jgi:hypothetical protein
MRSFVNNDRIISLQIKVELVSVLLVLSVHVNIGD